MKTWIANVLLAGAATGLAVGLAEATVRIVAPRSTSLSHQDRHGLALHYPGITRYVPEHGQTVTINSVGMRDREHPLEKPGGTFRIMVLGDSFMEAIQVPREVSFPGVLEASLDEQSDLDVEVINAAVSGWGTDDQLRYLTEYGLSYEPDLIVVAVTLHNDVSDNLRERWHRLGDGGLVPQAERPIPWFTYKTLQFKAALAVRLQLVQLYRESRHRAEMTGVAQDLSQHVRALFDEPAKEQILRGLDLTGRLLVEIGEVGKSVGAETWIVLLPIEGQLSEEGLRDLLSSGSGGVAAPGADRPQDAVRERLAGEDVVVVDLLPNFRSWTTENGDPLFLDYDGHWNSAGHRLAASVVADRLLKANAVPGIE